MAADIPRPRPIRRAPGQRLRPPGTDTYDERYESPSLRGALVFAAVIAAWWGIDWLVRAS